MMNRLAFTKFVTAIVTAVALIGVSQNLFAQEIKSPKTESQVPEAVPARPPVEKMELNLDSESIHNWERYVRGFRREHQFAVVGGYSSGVWELHRFGTIEGEKAKVPGAFAKFQYSFHLPIYKGFGYLLGSSFGALYESSESESKFKSTTSVMLPGVLGGLVYNFSPAFRCTMSGEIYLERLDGIKDRDGISPDDEVHITMESFDGSLGVDWFYSLKWAVRLEGHLRRLVYVRPQKPDGKPVDANIKKRDEWVGLGILHHLL